MSREFFGFRIEDFKNTGHVAGYDIASAYPSTVDLDEVFEPRPPRDDEEQDAVRPLYNRDGCPTRHGVGFRCTRTLGHRGDHVCGHDGSVLARWAPGAER